MLISLLLKKILGRASSVSIKIQLTIVCEFLSMTRRKEWRRLQFVVWIYSFQGICWRRRMLELRINLRVKLRIGEIDLKMLPFLRCPIPYSHKTRRKNGKILNFNLIILCKSTNRLNWTRDFHLDLWKSKPCQIKRRNMEEEIHRI